jgi:hypothetical protein
MPSSNVLVASANTFTGISGDITRVASIVHSKRSDSLRSLWFKYILPPLVKEEFLMNVIKSDAFLTMFKFDIPADFDTSIPWNTYSHIAAYQNLSQIADTSIMLRLVPWQIRFEFAPETHSRLLYTSNRLDDEIANMFMEAGWHFWRTKTGFCIAPLELFKELRCLSELFTSWTAMGDFKGAGFDDFKVDDCNDMPPLEDEPVEKNAQRPRLDSLEMTSTNSTHYVGGSNAASGKVSFDMSGWRKME